MAISTPTGATPAADLQSLVAAYKDLANTQQSLQRQLNGRPTFSGIGSDGKSATGVAPGSLQARSIPGGGIAFSVADGTQNFGTEYNLMQTVTGSLVFQTGTGAPNTTDFPTAGTFAWYKNTSTGKYYTLYNDAGTIVFPDFASISGTISDGQHGARSGGSLHPEASSSVDGFMSASDKSKLDGITPTTAANDSNVVERNSGVINALSYNASGVQVVGSRSSGWNNIPVTPLRNGSAITTTFNSTNFGLLVQFVATVVNQLGVANHGLLDA